MRKEEFVAKLRAGLSGMPYEDVEERVSFYNEMMEDRIEDGLPEEEAVAAIGDVDEIILQIINETPFYQIVKEKVKPKRRLHVWETILLILGAPIWISILCAAAAAAVALYISVWSIVISLWAAAVSIAACAVAGIVAAVVFAVEGSVPAAVAMIGAGLLLGGISIFSIFACNGITRGAALLTKKIVLGIKTLFVGKGE